MVMLFITRWVYKWTERQNTSCPTLHQSISIALGFYTVYYINYIITTDARNQLFSEDLEGQNEIGQDCALVIDTLASEFQVCTVWTVSVQYVFIVPL